MTTDIRSFLRIIRLVVNQSTVPVMEFHERVIFLSSAVLCKSMWCYYSLCKIHRDDTFYNLSTYVCDWSLGTHEFSAFNFILKIGCDSRHNRCIYTRHQEVGEGLEELCRHRLEEMPARASLDALASCGTGGGEDVVSFFWGIQPWSLGADERS